MIYLISSETGRKNYVGSTVTSFKERFDNHKSSVIRFGKGQRWVPGKHLYKRFFEDGHEELKDMIVKIIDKTNVSDPTNRESLRLTN